MYVRSHTQTHTRIHTYVCSHINTQSEAEFLEKEDEIVLELVNNFKIGCRGVNYCFFINQQLALEEKEQKFSALKKVLDFVLKEFTSRKHKS